MLIAGGTGGTKTEMAIFSSKTGPHSPLDQTRVPGRRKLLIRSSIGQPCFNSDGWWAPGSTTIETTSLGVQVGGEKINLVVLSLDKDRRAKLLSKRFTLGADASAAWGKRKERAHEDPNVKILVYAQTKGAFAGFGLDGATFKSDDSGNKSPYRRTVTNHDIVEKNPSVPSDL